MTVSGDVESDLFAHASHRENGSEGDRTEIGPRDRRGVTVRDRGRELLDLRSVPLVLPLIHLILLLRQLLPYSTRMYII